MHPALLVVELLYRIFDEPVLDSQPVGTKEHYLRRHPLLSLALSCKTFSPVALHVLWREIDGIDQLLWTMSDDIIKITPPASSPFYSSISDRPRGCLSFKKQPVEQDWESFDRYGTLVTRLKNRAGYSSGDLLVLSPDVLEALNARYSLKNTPLLPNLHSLTCLGQQLQYSHTLLGPQLHSLIIPDTQYYSLSYDVQAFLTLARLNPPHRLDLLELTSIRKSGTDSAGVGQLFSDLIVNIQQNGEGLRRVCAHLFSWHISLEALNLILTNDRTRDVQVGVEEFDLDRVLPSGTFSSKNLHTVRIKTENGITSNSLPGQSFFHEFFRRLGARNLVCFTFIGGPKYLSIVDAKTIFTFFHYEKALNEDINELSPMIQISAVEASDGMAIDLDQYICTFANSLHLACQPMSSTDPTPRFAYLETLELNILVDLTDSDIGILSSSMPRLTCFRVETSRTGRTGLSRTTLVAIWLLAKNCQAIQSIAIWFSAILDWDQFAATTQVDVESVNDEEGRWAALEKATNLNLLTVNVGDSSIADMDVAIEFFHTVCPHLKLFGDIGEDWEGWGTVRAALMGESDSESSSFASAISSSECSDSSDYDSD